ncbi:DUF2339 domain-containing protein [Longirhabdus pacifica]|uniref:DUF2339 domain-containing protein n=1 Tax=Longirhabdus pacifica TaxID=2305227 RepID=UPI0013E8B4C6|nr:DUF2339 domain-containing protein [Longirhabdus pacifica]
MNKLNKTNDWVKQYWTSLLGGLFIVAAVAYAFKFVFNQGWISDAMIVAIGLIVGSGAIIPGAKLRPKLPVAGESIIGLGTAVIYATFSFAGIYFALWEPIIVFLCMVAVTIGVSIYAYKMDLRIVLNLALVGGYVAPLVMQSDTDQVFTLFLYLLVINSMFVFVSLQKQWMELKILPFVGTWVMYTVYYIHYSPNTDGLFNLPIRYAVASYLFFVLVFFVSSWINNLKFDGLNLYLTIVNAIIFSMWSLQIFEDVQLFSYTLTLMGVTYLIITFVMYYLTKIISPPVMIHFLGGVFLLLLSFSKMVDGVDVKPMIMTYIWVAIALVIILIGRFTFKSLALLVSGFIWLGDIIYWLLVTWDTPRADWFGTYIPFLNWGAFVWIIFVIMGFYYASALKESEPVRFHGGTNISFSSVVAIISHLMIAGLISVQINNMFEEYSFRYIDYDLTLSLAWGIHAVLLFLWGGYIRNILFKVFGGIVIGMVAVKTLIFDLTGEETIYRVIILFILGALSFLITYINKKFKTVEDTGKHDRNARAKNEQNHPSHNHPGQVHPSHSHVQLNNMKANDESEKPKK